MRTRFTLILCLLMSFPSLLLAQNPKWAEKAREAVLTIMCYDDSGSLLRSGNAFLVNEDGTALSDYNLFKGAASATAVTALGEQVSVTEIIGANDLYDFIKFRVDVSKIKKPVALELSATPLRVGEKVYLLPYSTQKKFTLQTGSVQEVSKAGASYSYYTLGMEIPEKMTSCPLLTEDGKVSALAQPTTTAGSRTAYGVDARFADALSTSALGFTDETLQTIGIDQALPDNEEQALAMVYMASTTAPRASYERILERFLQRYPSSVEGLMRRATSQIEKSVEAESMKEVEADLNRAESLEPENNNLLYLRASLIYSYLLTVAQKDAYEGWNLERALEYIDRALAVSPAGSSYKLKGDILYAMGSYDKALEAFNAANATSEKNALTFYSAARCKEQLEDYDGALALMDSCMSTFTYPFTQEGAAYLYEHARICGLQGNYRQAFNDYVLYENLASVAKEASFYYDRSVAALQIRNYQTALQDLERAMEMEPDDLDFKAQYAVVNMRVGRNQQAVDVLTQAIASAPDRADLYRLRGLAMTQMKDKKGARENFQKAIDLGDDQAPALLEKYAK